MDFGNSAGFSDFSAELEDFAIKKTRDFDRQWRIGSGGSILHSEMKDGVAYFGDCNGYFHALDLETGEALWRFRANDRIMGTPAIDGERIYFGSFDGNLYCLSSEGKEIWRFESGGGICRPVLCYEGMVYFGSRDCCLYCLDGETGKEMWRFRTGGDIGSGACVSGGRVYFGSYDGNFYCLSAEGKEIWRIKTGDHIQLFGSPLIHGERVYFGSFDNYFYAADAMTGNVSWKFKFGVYGSGGRYIEYRGVLYFPSRDGILYALTPEGKEIWRFRTGMEIFDFPKIRKGKLFFGCWDCHYYCIDIKTRELLWRFDTSSLSPAYLPPTNDIFQLEINTHKPDDDVEEEKYSVNISNNVMDSGSEYSVKSEYVTKNEYA
ncbi:MAG: PQQ-binding-like beta-propeller repeat protein [Candidatus Aenigmarchaeota archaeon]|nr:PQQ-binding-like beta-propeller repeat protein [Candidatus Aenigmarchaeota archaeon]